MFNKISLKIGFLFFMFILIIESILFFILYTNLVDDRIEEIMDSLLARGNTHSAVLEDDFSSPTLEHVGLMESASDFAVIITDPTGSIIINSDPVNQEMREIIEHNDYEDIPTEGKIVEEKWKEKEYIVADSPITIKGKHQGHVFMFAHTNGVKKVVDHLSDQFLIVGIITVFLTIVTIFILSRFITLPLIKIKEATEQLNNGNKKVELNLGRKDELGELSNSIRTLSQDLDRLRNDRNEFLASVSHELRTPLTYIKGYADIISRSDINEENRREYIGIIREETEQLNSLIKNLFELAKIDKNNFVIYPEKVFLEELIDTLANRIKPALAEKNITFSVYCPKNVVAYVDSERFQQVLLNILDNAANHSFEGGNVKLEVNETNQDIHIIITDNGEGIAQEDLPKIFDRLYRVEKSRSRKSGGSGLGLAIVKEIIESHEGKLEVRSELGKGTSVIISLRRVNKDE
ncbi:Alkaline phosphatase synthesis sensor protein PhoR [Oceanobacillus picturae]|uniref:histidine kinase n=1 Tax=Oceanobacillus picturae TaxID=171693 RepID=W9ANV1_9BACI|nr:HAMP domain-containing sensor histidine kinase [Oceanobacillus picturae]RIU91342.1 sensor histidine kinase [Oceanobacillus picturae]CDO04321.1 Alkaline phosphatase synthesis sensor protein PhoR [Oceanobacillus picturae]